MDGRGLGAPSGGKTPPSQEFPQPMDLESCWRQLAQQNVTIQAQQKMLEDILGELHLLRQEKNNPQVSLTDLTKALDKKEAPPPCEFTIDSGKSFAWFLSQFESYCSGKFTEYSKERWTGELSKHLKGEILEMFHVYGGDEIPYSDMKVKLTTYCDSEMEKGKIRKREKYMFAALGPDESVYMYANRLERLFLAAYPGRESDMEIELPMKLLSSVPATTRVNLERDLSVVRAASLSGSISWANVKEMVKSQKASSLSPHIPTSTQRLPKNEPIWFTSSNVNNMSMSPPQNPPERSRERQRSGYPRAFRSRSFARTPPQGPSVPRRSYGGQPQYAGPARKNYNSGFVVSRCDFCDFPGHTVDICWRRLGCCLRCGSADHRMRDCHLPLTRSSRRNEFVPGRQESRSPPKRGVNYSNRRTRSLDQQRYLHTTPLNPNSPAWQPNNGNPHQGRMGEDNQWALNH